MGTLFSDDFNRANSTSLGGNWNELSGDWEILSNTCHEIGGFAASILTNTTSLGTADYAVAADITQGDLVSGVNRGMGLVARLQDANNFYLAWINEGGTPVQLYAVVGGGFTTIGSWTPGSVMSDPVALRLECQGTTISVFVNGTSRISVTNSAHSAEGDFGMRIFRPGAFINHRYDNLVVTDFAAAGTTLNPGTIGSGEVVFSPAVTRSVLPNAIATAEVVFSPTVTTAVVPNAIPTAEVLFAPTVTLQVRPNAIATAEVVFNPTVTAGAVAGQVGPGTITSGEVVYAPTVTQSVLPAAIATAVVVYSPFVALLTPQTVQPDAIGTAAAVYDPLVTFTSPDLHPDGIPSAERVYAPTVTIIVRPLSPPPVLVRVAPTSAPALHALAHGRPPALTLKPAGGRG